LCPQERGGAVEKPTEAGRKHLLHPNAFADWQVVAQAELSVAVVTVRCSIFFSVLCLLVFALLFTFPPTIVPTLVLCGEVLIVCTEEEGRR